MKSFQLQQQLIAAIFAAIIAVVAQITIPLPIVPLTLQTFIVGLTATILGRKVGTWAIVIYLVLGAIGLPVFAGGSAGIGALFGPTGGYLWGFIVCGLTIGSLIQLKPNHLPWAILANMIGFVLTLIIGSIWLKFATGMPISQALMVGGVNFLLPDLIKATCAGILGVIISQRLPKKFLQLVQN